MSSMVDRFLDAPTDVRGVPILVGNTIAYAALAGRSAVIRVGVVTAIVEAKASMWTSALTTKIKVRVTNPGDVHSGPEIGKIITLGFPGRTVVIG